MFQMIDSAVVDSESLENGEHTKKRPLLSALGVNQQWNQENNYAVNLIINNN